MHVMPYILYMCDVYNVFLQNKHYCNPIIYKKNGDIQNDRQIGKWSQETNWVVRPKRWVYHTRHGPSFPPTRGKDDIKNYYIYFINALLYHYRVDGIKQTWIYKNVYTYTNMNIQINHTLKQT